MVCVRGVIGRWRTDENIGGQTLTAEQADSRCRSVRNKTVQPAILVKQRVLFSSDEFSLCSITLLTNGSYRVLKHSWHCTAFSSPIPSIIL